MYHIVGLAVKINSEGLLFVCQCSRDVMCVLRPKTKGHYVVFSQILAGRE